MPEASLEPKRCSAVLLRCTDFRLTGDVNSFMSALGFRGDFDDVGAAGASKNIVDPYDASDPEFVLRQIAISRKVHGIKTVVLMNHTDCSAYGVGTFASYAEERDRHLRDLTTAKSVVEHRFEDIQALTILARIDEDGKVDFESIQ